MEVMTCPKCEVPSNFDLMEMSNNTTENLCYQFVNAAWQVSSRFNEMKTLTKQH